MTFVTRMFEVGLTHILAVVGLLASVFVWRAVDVGHTVDRITAARRARTAGRPPRQWRNQNLWLSLLQLALWLVSLIGGILTVIGVGRFLALMAKMYSALPNADATVIEVLGRRADVLRGDIVVAGLVICGLLISEWIVGLWVDNGAERDDQCEGNEHIFFIPEEWRDDPVGMWHERHVFAEDGCEMLEESWLKDWDKWVEMVGHVRDRDPMNKR